MSFQDLETVALNNALESNETYEDYLNTFINPTDLNFLGNIEVARQLVELGINVKTQILGREEFYTKKEALHQLKLSKLKAKEIVLNFKSVDPALYENNPLLKAIADREEQIKNDYLATILYIRAAKLNSKGRTVEISGYVDLSERFNKENFVKYYKGDRLFLPKTTDLSYYNWNTGSCVFNDTKMFKNESDIDHKRLGFKNKRDRKIVWTDIEAKENPAVKITQMETDNGLYKQIIIFDQVLNIKNY